LIDATAVVELGLVSPEMHAEGSEQEGHVDEQLAVDVSTSVHVSDAENPPAEVASAHETVASDAALVLRHFRVIDRGAVCGLLLEWLQDISFCFVCITVLFVRDCVSNFCFSSK
jgi:hypothetical protein